MTRDETVKCQRVRKMIDRLQIDLYSLFALASVLFMLSFTVPKRLTERNDIIYKSHLFAANHGELRRYVKELIKFSDSSEDETSEQTNATSGLPAIRVFLSHVMHSPGVP